MRFLRVPIVICIGVLGCLNTAPAFACTSDEITLSNGNCVPAQFSMTVGGFPSDGDDFTFYVSAKGTLYIDWGGMDIPKQKLWDKIILITECL